MIEKDTYKTITKASPEVLFKEKNSKFFGYAFPVHSEDVVKLHIEELKKQHHSARHWCYAYQLGKEERNYQFRANDDGEPNNSAGMPIYGQIQSFDVTNVLIVVVRYFGGIKLGVGGLISAYKTTAQMALEQSKIVRRTINQDIELKFEYKDMNKVMRVIKEKNLKIKSQTLELDCKIIISVRLKNSEAVFEAFQSIFGVQVKCLES
ncbi:putative YigZ family protein [Gelidibacter sediminis]|uniref:Putative YigZ family protein n=1 Tax=Gelidibacter sediminis TaxID=1608710 RepID=A0A4R7Q239_9FLAO|nr:YigZ family protein [Gelidibacter sediminis]TDU40571.1 putative YigZ family protein [Gelidibacter sediminis]